MQHIFVKRKPRPGIIGLWVIVLFGWLWLGSLDSTADNKETGEPSDTRQPHETEDVSHFKSDAQPESSGAVDLHPVHVTITPVKKEKLVLIIKTIGTLDPVVEELSFKINGRLKELLVDEGDHVKKNQIIARLELDDALSHQAQQEIALEQAQRKFYRLKKLYDAGSINKENYEDAMNQLEQIRISYSQAKLIVERCTLKAPGNGKIIKKHLEYFTSLNPGEPVYRFQNSQQPWIIKVNLTDQQIFSVSMGTPAEVSFHSLPGQIFQGQITQIALQANPSDGLYGVEVTLISGPKDQLIPGMVADVKIVQTSERAYTIVPLASLLNLKGMEGYLFLASHDLKYAIKKSVSVNSIFRNDAALENDLDLGQMVIVHGNQKLEDKNPIIVVQ
ncbi:MAG: efflux RND transporter periplasmic adaptor subunit [Deltaproteobacteria bacterium]|nr:efflux RND transporter periplasmic adaptor subunit [Deltaproteobacteria bacterium]